MKSLQQIEEDISTMAKNIDAPSSALPTYGRSMDGARPHIEVSSGAYNYVIVERGCELERRRTNDYQEFLYWIFVDVTHHMAFEFELHNRMEGQDCRRIAFPKQVELMTRLGPLFGDRVRREIDKILKKAPYDDEPTRELNRRQE